MDLVNELLKHANDNNILYVNEISSIIIEYKLKTLDDLRNFEDSLITKKGTLIKKEDRLNFCREIIDNSIFESDGLSDEELDQRYYLRKDMEKGTIEDMTLAAIKYLMISKRDNLFPYSTYMFIMDGKL